MQLKKIRLIVVVMVLMIALNTTAQSYLGISVGPQFPSSNLEGTNTGFGINGSYKYLLKGNFAVGLNLGYTRFVIPGFDLDLGFGNISFPSASISSVPVTGLVEYHFGNQKIHPYIGTDVGVYITTASVTSNVNESMTTERETKSGFGFAPTGGIIFGLNEKTSLCLNIKYNNVTIEGSTATWIGVNAGLIFKMK